MVDHQPIQDPMIPDGSFQEPTAGHMFEAARGNLSLEWELTDKAIAGAVRNLRTLLERQGHEGVDRVIRPHYEEPWQVSFPAGEADYVVSHDDVWRPSKHYLTERLILTRTEGGVTNRALLCTIQGLKHEDEQIHLGPKAELTIGDSEPVTGVEALAGLEDAFPELGLVWVSRPSVKEQENPTLPQFDDVVMI